jgi:predicted aminopeptidase
VNLLRRRRLVRVRWGGIGIVLLAIVAGGALLVAVTPMGRYLARGAWAEAKILSRRQSIARLAADSATPGAVRAKLQLVLEARSFAVDSLGLPAKNAFTQFSQLDHDTLVLVLSGAQRDRLRPVTWWFPVVGNVPYKGYFDFEEAKRAEREMQDAGYDTYLRPSPAFSTLGFFNDPLLSTTLHDDSVEIVNTVIHELTHNRFYMKGHAVFNESFASFVGARGAERFFRARGDTASARRSAARWDDDLLLGAVWERTYVALDSAFRAWPADSSRAARLESRDTIYARTRAFLVDSVGPRLKTIDPRYAARVRLDNAALLARRIYATGLPDFEAMWVRADHDLRRAIERIVSIARESPSDPGAALRARAAADR